MIDGGRGGVIDGRRGGIDGVMAGDQWSDVG